MLEDGDPIPGWLRRGCLDELRQLILADPRLAMDRKDLDRYLAVKLARWNGAKWKDNEVFEAAARDLHDQKSDAAASGASIRLSYLRINKLFKGGAASELSAVDPIDHCDLRPSN